MRKLIFMVIDRKDNKTYYEFLSEAKEYVRKHGGIVWKQII